MRRSGSVLPLHKLLMKKILHAVGRLYQTPITGWRFTETPYNPIQVLIIAASLSIFCAAGFAQTADNVAEREVHRRQAVIPQGEAALERGKATMIAKNYTVAHEQFRIALTYLPDAVVSGKAYDEAVEGFCKSGVILAEARIAEVEEVKQLLTEADGFYNSGRYDLAFKRYDQVLTLDPYNTAARRGQEKINNTKYKYGEEAYNETRSRQLWQV